LLRFAVRFLRLLGKDPSRWGRNSDIDLESLANVDFPAHVRIDYRSASEKKILASACHASQGGNAMRRGLVGWIFRLFGETDTFMRAQPPVPPGSRLQTDFFD
jgi:mycothiol S-conjugate amidase